MGHCGYRMPTMPRTESISFRTPQPPPSLNTMRVARMGPSASGSPSRRAATLPTLIVPVSSPIPGTRVPPPYLPACLRAWRSTRVHITTLTTSRATHTVGSTTTTQDGFAAIAAQNVANADRKILRPDGFQGHRHAPKNTATSTRDSSPIPIANMSHDIIAIFANAQSLGHHRSAPVSQHPSCILQQPR